MENYSLLICWRKNNVQVNLAEYINKNKKIIENHLYRSIEAMKIPKNLKDSMLYSLQAGGKRLRPILLFASYESYAVNIEKVLNTACALEMIHTYSLIHDDLPAMDDDDYRRGKLTNHKVYGEATAILAGDALLTHSFELVTNDPLLTDKEKVFIVQLLSRASGASGMVAGQILDMEAENKQVSLEKMEEIHRLKTGELISFAITAGAYLANTNEKQVEHLSSFATYLGLIFQVQDDILDVTGDPEKLGKPVGSDSGNQKSTYPNLLGLEGAIDIKNKYVVLAKEALQKAEVRANYLEALTEYFTERDH